MQGQSQSIIKRFPSGVNQLSFKLQSDVNNWQVFLSPNYTCDVFFTVV